MAEQKYSEVKALKYIKHKEYSKALSYVMDSFSEPLYWHINQMVRNHDDTDDIIQNTFLKAWKGLPNFRYDSKLSTWLYRIATNETFTFLEKIKKDKDRDQIYIENNGSKHATSDITGSAIEEKLELALNTLPPKQKKVFLLRYYSEKSYEEISEILETSEGALKASYHFAVKKIKDFIQAN